MVHLVFLLIGFEALACDLNLHWPKSSSLDHPIQAHVAIQNDELMIQFEIHSPSLNAKEKFEKGEAPYMYDAVEVFYSTNPNGLPYYEFEVSPYNQQLIVKVDEHKHHTENAKHEFTSTATFAEGGWVAELHIPLEKDTPPEKVIGNLYGILGKKVKAAPGRKPSNRTYWSAFLPNQPAYNFHQPEFFQPLLMCGEDQK